jgi:hypothetical protein
MYCSNCGAEASGNFCARCGKPLAGSANHSAAPAQTYDWAHETSYRALIGRPIVRDLLAQASARAKASMSGEEFLDKFLFKGVPVAEPIVGMIVPLYEQLGAKTGKKRAEHIELPVGRAVVAALCALASRGQHLKDVRQADNGCLITAEIPSDIWSWAGELRIAISADGDGTRIEAETYVPGQMFDWGKSKRVINQLYDGVHRFALLQP